MWVALLVAALSLAGCAGEPAADDATIDEAVSTDVADAVDEVVDLATDLTATDEVPAPEWAVGDWFGHHIFFGEDDQTGEHINAVVVSHFGDTVELLTDDPYFAKVEGTYDIPILGTIQTRDLSTESFGGKWHIYDFPITDGKTWQGEVDLSGMGGDQMLIDFEATYAESITGVGGTFPGFKILGTVAGVTAIETDFVPAIGWYNEFILYNIDTEEDLEDYMFRSINMGFGNEWEGTLYEAVGERVVNLEQQVYPDPQSGAVADVQPYASFQVRSDATDLFGYAYSFAFGGVSKVEIVDPDGTMHGPQPTVGVGTEFAFNFDEYDMPAKPGQWHAAIASGGAISGGGVSLSALEMVEVPFPTQASE